jgi:Leucine-rich repeat (LRR) protein
MWRTFVKMRGIAKVGIFGVALLWAQEGASRIVIYESMLERYFQIPGWASASALAKPDTVRFLRLQGSLPQPLPALPRLQALYLEGIEELNLEDLLQKLPQKCPKLTVLALEDCEIDDLTPFRSFTMPIRGLILDQNDFSDVTPLSYLRSLEYLSMAETPVRSLAPLTGLPNLKALDIRETSITDLQILHRLQGLRMFSAYKTLALRDLTPLLAHQSTLEVLNISFLPAGTTAPIWDNLPGFRALKVLIAQEAIPDKATLQKIAKLSTLEELTIGRNPIITDLYFAQSLPNLLYLDVHSCAVQDLTPLAKHPNLIKLIIARNPIASLAPLKTCPRLSDLYCYEVPAKDWEGLLEIPSLTHVMLKKTDLPPDKRDALLMQLRRKGVRVDVS